MGFREELAGAAAVIKELKKRGVRILGGGDYGFGLTPHGQNARDIEHFVKYCDFTPMEALLTMTKYGGEAMDPANQLGQIKENYLADLMLVKSNPLEDPNVLTDPDNLIVIMKDGQFHKQ